MTAPHPPVHDWEFERKQAKALLRAFRSADPAALTRVKKHLPRLRGASDGEMAIASLALADAQLVVARERGFPSWTKLKRHIEAQQPLHSQAERFLGAIRDRRRTLAKSALARHPALARFSIHTAAAAGERDALAEMLRADPALAVTPHGEGFTPLLYLCASPLHAGEPARAARMLQCAELLLDAGADPNEFTLSDGEDAQSRLPALYSACVGDNVALVRLLLERGAEPNDGESVYHAAELNHVDCLELLRAAGADLGGRHAHWGNTPLYFLSGYGEQDPSAATATLGMRWLLEHGADPNVTSLPAAETPLHRAAQNGRSAQVAEMLLAHGGDPLLPRADGRTAYVLAVRAGNEAIVRLLRSRGAGTEVPPVDALLGACARGDAGAARAILAAYPGLLDLFTAEDRGQLALAAGDGRLDSVRLMAELGFDPTWEADWGGTALHHASWRGDPAMVRLLLDLHAPVNARDSRFGSSPLGWAAHGSRFSKGPDEGHCKVVLALLAAGAERASSINRWGEPPESMASRRVAALLASRMKP